MDPPNINVGKDLAAIHGARRVALEGGSAYDVADAIRTELCLGTDLFLVTGYLEAAFILTMFQPHDLGREARSTSRRPVTEIEYVRENQPFWSNADLWQSETIAWATSRRALEEASGMGFRQLMDSNTSWAASYTRDGQTHVHSCFELNHGESYWTLSYSRPMNGFWTFERIMAGNIKLDDPLCITCQTRKG